MSRTTPITSRHTIVFSVRSPNFLPTADSFGQKCRAIAWLMMATGGLSPFISAGKSRPSKKGMPSVAK